MTTSAPGRRTRGEWLAVAGLLVTTAVLYIWDLAASGWANSFYAAAVQAGTESWKAALFGASDAAGSITVDKPPASLWAMEISTRIFGMNSWAMLIPQAIMGVATVFLVYAAVRRRFSAPAAISAGAILALTPVAALMFRFNNPDALLVLLLSVAAYAVIRATEDGRTRWMILAGAAIGFGFLTKQLQAFVVVPGFALAYLWAAPVPIGRRIRDAALSLGALVVSAGWWVALVELWPASSRPYIGGSQNNSFLELTFGYNGLGRLSGNETGSVGGGGGGMGGGAWGSSGITRLFDGDIGGQIAWLLPAALIVLVAAFVITARRSRTSVTRSSLIVWGSWLVVTGLVFSFMAGIFHQYYTVALAPAVAAVVAMGVDLLWRERRKVWATVVLATVVAVCAVWAIVLLRRSAGWNDWLTVVVAIAGAIGIALLLIGLRRAELARWGLIAATVAALIGPAAYTIQTVLTPHSGSIVTAGPTVASNTGGPGAMGGGGMGGPGGQGGPGQGAAGQNSQNGMPGAPPNAGQNGGQMPGGAPGSTSQNGAGQNGTGPQAMANGMEQNGMGGGGGMGGLLNSTTPSTAMTSLLNKDASKYTWVAATIGSQNASGYQLATGKSVMPIGGFNGSDPSPTLAQFKQYVADGKIHYFIASGSMGGGGSIGGGGGQGGPGGNSSITTWVEDNFTAKTVDGTTVYDLTSPKSSSGSSSSSAGPSTSSTSSTT